MDIVTRARYFAEIHHKGQIYAEEVPYSVHLENVVATIRRFQIDDPQFLAAGYLHDVIEDTAVSYGDIKTKFGEKVAELVFHVTNERGRNRKERNAKTYQKLVVYADTVILKMADRIANVEYGMATGGKQAMYREEYPDFRKALFCPGTEPTKPYALMWEHLDRLLG